MLSSLSQNRGASNASLTLGSCWPAVKRGLLGRGEITRHPRHDRHRQSADAVIRLGHLLAGSVLDPHPIADAANGRDRGRAAGPLVSPARKWRARSGPFRRPAGASSPACPRYARTGMAKRCFREVLTACSGKQFIPRERRTRDGLLGVAAAFNGVTGCSRTAYTALCR